jgi:hypothetical protein
MLVRKNTNTMGEIVKVVDFFSKEHYGDIRVFGENTLSEIKQKLHVLLQKRVPIFSNLLGIYVRDGLTQEMTMINKPVLSTMPITGRRINYIVKNESTILYAIFTKSGFVHDNILYLRNGYINDIPSRPLSQNDPEFDILLGNLGKLYGEISPYQIETLISFKTGGGDASELELEDEIKKGTVLNLYEAKLVRALLRRPASILLEKIIVPGTDGAIEIYPFRITSSILSFRNPGLYINIQKLFDLLQTSEAMPFIGIGKGIGEEPAFKVLKSFRESKTGEKLLSLWMFDTKGVRLTAPKGLQVKLMMDEGKYLSVSIFSHGLVSVRSSWGADENAGVSEVRQSVSRLVPLIKYANSFPIVFDSDSTKRSGSVDDDDDNIIEGGGGGGRSGSSLVFPTFEKAIVSSLDSYISIPFNIPLKDILAGIRGNELYSQLFEVDDTTTTTTEQDGLRLKFIRLPPAVQVDDYRPTLLYTITLSLKNVKDKGLSVFCFGCKTFAQIQSMHEYLVSIIETLLTPARLERAKIQKKAVRKVQQIADERKPTEILTMLKSYGIPVNSRSCQKQRQPVVDDNEEIPLLTGVDGPSYRMNFLVESTGRTHKITCANKNVNHVYPGITKAGVPCCFLNRQEKYVPVDVDVGAGVGVGATPQVVEPSPPRAVLDEIINIDPIMTSKILDPGRIGVLPPKTLKMFKSIEKVRGISERDGDTTTTGGGRGAAIIAAIKARKSRRAVPIIDPEPLPPIYRFGIPETENSFLDCILLYIKKEGRFATQSIRDLKYNLVSFLVNSNVYRTLEVSDVISKNDYIDLVGNYTADTPIDMITELVSEYLNVHIYVFAEEPEGIVCTSIGDTLAYTRSIFLFYHSEKKNKLTNYGHYEPIVHVRPGGRDTASFVPWFDHNRFETMIKFIDVLYNFSCKVSYHPDAQEEKEQPTASHLASILALPPKYQVVNAFNEVMYIIGSPPILVPVKPTKPILNIDIISPALAFKSFKKNAETTIQMLEDVNDLLASSGSGGSSSSSSSGLYPIYQILDAKDETIATAIVTNSGLVVPIVPSPRVLGMDIARMHYVEDIDYYLAGKDTFKDDRSRIMYKQNIKVFSVSQGRIEIANHLVSIEPNLQKEMINVIENLNLSKSAKQDYIGERVQEILGQTIGSPRQNKRDGRGKGLELDFELPIKRVAISDITVASECNKNPVASWYEDFGNDSRQNGRCRFSIPDESKFSDVVQILTNEILSDPSRKLLYGKIDTEIQQSGATYHARPNEVLLYTFEEALEFIKNTTTATAAPPPPEGGGGGPSKTKGKKRK